MSRDRPIVLVPCDYFLPGYKAGGPIRTVAGVIKNLQEEFVFRIVTRDRDLGDTNAYNQVPINTWQTLGAAEIMYLPPRRTTPWALRRLIWATDHNVLYLNSCFSVPFTIVPLLLRRFGLTPRRPVIIGPRGELAPGALAFKRMRKRLYLAMARLLGLISDVTWQASGAHEAEDISRHIGRQARIVIAPDLVAAADLAGPDRIAKEPGHLRLVFLSRVSRMKNLDGALKMLQRVAGSVRFSIYGPIEDSEYWRHCQELIAQLPPNVTAIYEGSVRPDRVPGVMKQHDALFLPTLGEAFGHVILEALVSGTPVLISDRTRWRGLESAGVGWDVSLDRPERFLEVIDQSVGLDSAAWAALSDRAAKYGAQNQNDVEARDKNHELFWTVYRGTVARSGAL